VKKYEKDVSSGNQNPVTSAATYTVCLIGMDIREGCGKFISKKRNKCPKLP
jgi:hypothetical protein